MAWMTRRRREDGAPVETPASLDAETPRARIASRIVGAPTRAAGARGLYRVFNAAEFRFYRALAPADPPAEGDAAWATSTTLPATPASVFADGTWYLACSYCNGIVESGFLAVGPRGETYLTLTISSGVVTAVAPSTPMGQGGGIGGPRLQRRAGGVVRVQAWYVAVADGADQATQWALAYTVDGSTPAADAPSITVVMGSGGLQVLSRDLPAQAHGTTVKVRLQVRRSDGLGGWIYSDAGTVLTAVADAAGPTAPLAGSS